MLETAFPIVDKGPLDSSDDSPDEVARLQIIQLLQGLDPQYVKAALNDDRSVSSRDSNVAEIRGEDTRTSLGLHYDVDSSMGLSSTKPWRQATPRVTFHALQEWQGHVLERGMDEFTASLVDLSHDSPDSLFGVQEEEATIPLSEISENDLPRLRPGSIFRWVIGYERLSSGTKRRISQIVFRDLPVMTERDRSEGEQWAMRIKQSLVD